MWYWTAPKVERASLSALEMTLHLYKIAFAALDAQGRKKAAYNVPRVNTRIWWEMASVRHVGTLRMALR
jgi:hypothetical protein